MLIGFTDIEKWLIRLLDHHFATADSGYTPQIRAELSITDVFPSIQPHDHQKISELLPPWLWVAMRECCQAGQPILFQVKPNNPDVWYLSDINISTRSQLCCYVLAKPPKPQKRKKTMELETVGENLLRFQSSYDAALCKEFILHHVCTLKFNLMFKKINLT